MSEKSMGSESKILERELEVLSETRIRREVVDEVFVDFPYASLVMNSYEKVAKDIVKTYKELAKPVTDEVVQNFMLHQFQEGRILSNKDIRDLRRRIKSREYSGLASSLEIHFHSVPRIEQSALEFIEYTLRERFGDLDYKSAAIEEGILGLPELIRVIRGSVTPESKKRDIGYLRRLESVLKEFDPKKRLENYQRIIASYKGKFGFEHSYDKEKLDLRPITFDKSDAHIVGELNDLTEKLKGSSLPEHLDEIYSFWRRNLKIDRFGIFGVEYEPEEGMRMGCKLVPKEVSPLSFSEIGGYHEEKRVLTNLLDLLNKWPDEQVSKNLARMHVVLLAGEYGTGKSSSALALINSLPKHVKTLIINNKAFDSDFNYLKRKASDYPDYFFLGVIEDIDIVGKDRYFGERSVEELLSIDSVRTFPKNLILLGLTNRPQVVDPPFLRPGRTNILLYYDLPKLEQRREIIEIKEKEFGISLTGEERERLSKETDKFSGADIQKIFFDAQNNNKRTLEELLEIKENVKRQKELISTAQEKRDKEAPKITV
jgi:hypothetical protein